MPLFNPIIENQPQPGAELDKLCRLAVRGLVSGEQEADAGSWCRLRLSGCLRVGFSGLDWQALGCASSAGVWHCESFFSAVVCEQNKQRYTSISNKWLPEQLYQKY